MGDEFARQRRREAEAGYVLVLTAVLLIPLMIFTAFAVDTGAWLVQGEKQQRAADAAALAAVGAPEGEGEETARWVAAANGFPEYEQAVDAAGQPLFDANGDPVPDPTKPYAEVIYETLPDNRVQVGIRAPSDVYFGSVIGMEPFKIERLAVAEYIPPVGIGNPSSALGLGSFPDADGVVSRAWLAVSAYCLGRPEGDFVLTRFSDSGRTCPGTGGQNWTQNNTTGEISLRDYGLRGNRQENPQYDPRGYFLTVDLVNGSEAYDWKLQFYSPGICDLYNEMSILGWNLGLLADHPENSLKGVRLEATLYGVDDTPGSDYDNIDPANVVTTRLFERDDCGWVDFAMIPSSAERGRRVLNYRTLPVRNETRINYFGVRLVPANGPYIDQICSSRAVSWCPSVQGLGWVSMFTPDRGPDGTPMPAGTGSLYLGEIDSVHAGKTVRVSVYDPGSGSTGIHLVAPDLTRPEFTFETRDCADHGVCDVLDISGTNDLCTVSVPNALTPVAGTYPCLRLDWWRFVSKTIVMEFDLPHDYSCGSDCWWRVQIDADVNRHVIDRTAWKVEVVGDPIRLVE